MSGRASLAIPLAILALNSCAGPSPQAGRSAGPESPGARAYQKCLACHGLEPRSDDRDGPTLHGVPGRRIASVKGFAYSDAMRAYASRQGHWTREALDAFLADPQAAVPGNTMGFFGIPDPKERAELIDWLAD